MDNEEPLSQALEATLIESLPENDPALAARVSFPSPDNPRHALVAALATLTRQRDELALQEEFIKSAQLIWPGVAGWLVKVPIDSYPTHENLIVLGDAGRLPPNLAVTGLQLRSPEALSQFHYEARDFVLAHIARPHGGEEDLFVFEFDHTLSDHEMALLRDLLQIFKNHVLLLASHDHDGLTGLICHTQLQNRLTDQITARLHGRRFRQEGNADYIIVLSLDLFRYINERHGHQVGEAMLKRTADYLRETLHEDDLIFRLGGKEFAILIQDLNPQEARDLSERLRLGLADLDFSQDIRATASFGVTPLDCTALPQDNLNHARRALEYAKAHGRNQVQLYTALLTQGQLEMENGPKAIELF